MKSVWIIKSQNFNFPADLEEKHGPIILALLENRNITDLGQIEDFFNFDWEKNLTNPLKIPAIQKAVERIERAKTNPSAGREKIAIFGDYDADGVTASVLLHDTLKDLGFTNIVSYIPDRQTEGYGLNEKALEYLHGQKVNLIITVDCGITNISEIKKAQELGMDVIVTDHHHVGTNIPKALAVINPHLKKSGFRHENYAGVGVAYKLAQALIKKMNPQRISQLKWALDLVAIGTIADCVPLLGENRLLVKYGLLVLSKTRRLGFQEMFKVGRIAIDENNVPDTHKVAFQIAPRINAAGRMDHASTAYNLILEPDRAKARELALEMEGQNQTRQKITGEIVREVRILAENSFREKNFILAESPRWPVGVLGLVAGKIADEFRKPVAVLQNQGNELTGSLRSIPEIDIITVLEKCSGHLIKFGGHAQAAGIKIKKTQLQKFYETAEKIIDQQTGGQKFKPSLDIDLEIRPEDINWELVTNLKKMEPFGEGNPQPVFLIKNMNIYDLKICGNGNRHLKLSLGAESGSPKIFDSIGFSMGEKFPDLKTGDIIDVVFNLCEDSWNGSQKIQLKLIDLKFAG